MKKRKQHYVWRHYLRAWSNNDKIYCLGYGKIFIADLMGVANERDFYKIKELNENEIDAIKKIAIDDAPDILKAGHLSYLKNYTLVHKIKSKLVKSGLSNKKIDNQIDELINNIEEDYHAVIEANAIKYIDSILNKNIAFYKTEDGKIEFLYYLCTQYTRTNKIKNNVIKAASHQKSINAENIWNVLGNIFAVNIAFNLNRKEEFNLILLENCTDNPFITGDQPVVNTFAVDKNIDTPVAELELYYPVSPNLGLLLTKNENYRGKTLEKISNSDLIDLYNSYIYKESHEQIYSSSDEALKKYLSK